MSKHSKAGVDYLALLAGKERIAASCMEHGAKLISLDAHFADVDGLLRWNE